MPAAILGWILATPGLRKTKITAAAFAFCRISSQRSRTMFEEAVRRVGSIAIVHETLSQDSTQRVDFDLCNVAILQVNRRI